MSRNTYSTYLKVAALFQKPNVFTSTSNPSIEEVENIIERAEDFIDFKTRNSWKERQVTDEYHDLNANYIPYNGYPFFLGHSNIKSFSSTEGDKIEVWQGDTYLDYVASKTEGRGHDYWLNNREGILYLREGIGWTILSNLLKVTYRYGGLNTKINDTDGITNSDTTITVDSTAGFPLSSWIRIEDEEISYTGKTNTTFTGCTRAINETTAATHADNSVVLTVQADIEEAATKLAAAEVLGSYRQTMIIPDDINAGKPISDMINDWRTQAENIIYHRSEMRLGGKKD